MEDALRVHFWQAYGTSQRVLILVLMEDALRVDPSIKYHIVEEES